MIQVQVINWIIPYFGNSHIIPYGSLKVTDGKETKICKTKGDKVTDSVGYQYITFKRIGTLSSPIIKLELIK